MEVLPVAIIRKNVKYVFPRDSEALAKAHLGQMEEFLVQVKGKELPPYLILFTEEQEHIIDTRSFMKGEDEKDVLASFARKLASHMGAIASVFFSEVWFAQARPDEVERMRQGGEAMRPSLHPDRIECLMVVGEYTGMKPYMATSSIVRDSAGGVISFKPVLMPPGMECEGRFYGILGGAQTPEREEASP